METLDYLKNHLQTNIPLTVRIVKRVGQYPETDFNTKQPTGRMQTLYNFSLPTGETVRHYAKEREEETLGHFQAGEEVRVVRQEADKNGKRITFLVWTPTEGAESRLAANPPLKTNLQETASKRELKDREDERELKDIQICLQGFAQAFIASGSCGPDLPVAGMITASLDFAAQAREALLKKSREVHLGIPSPTIPEIDVTTLPF